MNRRVVFFLKGQDLGATCVRVHVIHTAMQALRKGAEAARQQGLPHSLV